MKGKRTLGRKKKQFILDYEFKPVRDKGRNKQKKKQKQGETFIIRYFGSWQHCLD